MKRTVIPKVWFGFTDLCDDESNCIRRQRLKGFNTILGNALNTSLEPSFNAYFPDEQNLGIASSSVTSRTGRIAFDAYAGYLKENLLPKLDDGEDAEEEQHNQFGSLDIGPEAGAGHTDKRLSSHRRPSSKPPATRPRTQSELHVLNQQMWQCVDDAIWLSMRQKMMQKLQRHSSHLKEESAKSLWRLFASFADTEDDDDEVIKVPVLMSAAEVEYWINQFGGIAGLEQVVLNNTTCSGTDKEDEPIDFFRFVDTFCQNLGRLSENNIQECLAALETRTLMAVFKSGYLNRARKARTKEMKKMWCVLNPRKLAFYENETASLSKGQIPMDSKVTVEISEDRSACFCLISSKDEYFFESASLTDKNDWIRAIHRAIATTSNSIPAFEEARRRKMLRHDTFRKRHLKEGKLKEANKKSESLRRALERENTRLADRIDQLETEIESHNQQKEKASYDTDQEHLSITTELKQQYKLLELEKDRLMAEIQEEKDAAVKSLRQELDKKVEALSRTNEFCLNLQDKCDNLAASKNSEIKELNQEVRLLHEHLEILKEEKIVLTEAQEQHILTQDVMKDKIDNLSSEVMELKDQLKRCVDEAETHQQLFEKAKTEYLEQTHSLEETITTLKRRLDELHAEKDLSDKQVSVWKENVLTLKEKQDKVIEDMKRDFEERLSIFNHELTDREKKIKVLESSDASHLNNVQESQLRISILDKKVEDLLKTNKEIEVRLQECVEKCSEAEAASMNKGVRINELTRAEGEQRCVVEEMKTAAEERRRTMESLQNQKERGDELLGNEIQQRADLDIEVSQLRSKLGKLQKKEEELTERNKILSENLLNMAQEVKK